MRMINDGHGRQRHGASATLLFDVWPLDHPLNIYVPARRLLKAYFDEAQDWGEKIAGHLPNVETAKSLREQSKKRDNSHFQK